MTHDLWATLNEKMHEYLSSVTLADLVAHQSGQAGLGDQGFPRLGEAEKVRGEGSGMRLPVYLDYSATTPVDPRVAEKMIPVPHRVLRQRGEPLARVRLEGGGGGRGGARARRGAGQRRPEGDRLDLGRDRGQQPRDQGRGELLQDQGQAPHHAEDRAQGDARHLRELERQGFEVTYLDVERERPGRPREVQGGAASRHDPGLDHDGEQRDRRDPAGAGDRRDLPREGHHLPLRRGAGDGQASTIDLQKLKVDLMTHHGAQDLRPEGHRRALRAPQAARAHRGADARRRPRARLPLGHARHAPDRRHRRGCAPREGRDGDRERAHPRAARPAARRA